ncbi:MAG: DUF2953 domain-containing protein [Clostridia bacterium]|jgi:hypothetical protein|nr:DUF2953 domain-containing protein [Clostridia bacterium]
MTALIVILSIALLIALLLSTKVLLHIRYEESLTVYLRVLFVKIRLYPSKKEKKKHPHSMSKRKAQKIKDSLQKKPKEEPKKRKSKKKEKEKEPKEAPDLISIISIITSFVKSFLRLFAGSVRIRSSRLHIVVAAEDAADTAIAYGALTQAINLLFPMLDGIKTFKHLPRGKELSVRADFLSDTSKIDADVELYIRVGSALKAVCLAAIRAFKKAVKRQLRQLERQK